MDVLLVGANRNPALVTGRFVASYMWQPMAMLMLLINAAVRCRGTYKNEYTLERTMRKNLPALGLRT